MYISSMVMNYPSQDLPDSCPLEGEKQESQGPKQGQRTGRSVGGVGDEEFLGWQTSGKPDVQLRPRTTPERRSLWTLRHQDICASIPLGKTRASRESEALRREEWPAD